MRKIVAISCLILGISCGKKSDEIRIQADLPTNPKPTGGSREPTEDEVIESTHEISIFDVDLKVEILEETKTFISKKPIKLKHFEHLQSLRFFSDEIAKVGFDSWGILLVPEPKEGEEFAQSIFSGTGNSSEDDLKKNIIRFKGKDVLDDINWLSGHGAKIFKLEILLVEKEFGVKASIIIPIENENTPGDGTVVGSENTPGGEDQFGSEIKGPCTLQGDIRNFTISCEKPVKNFLIGFMKSGKSIINTGVVNGIAHEIHVTNTGSGLTGYEKKASELNIAIHFDDGTVASVAFFRELDL